MPNLGSSDTPVEGQSFGLPAGAELGEDNRELVIKDSSGTIILRRNETASEWQFEGTDLSGINAIDASSATLEKLSTNHHFTAAYDGGDADARLDAAIAAASAGDMIWVESASYFDSRTISKELGIHGTGAGVSTAKIDSGTWTLDARIVLNSIHADGQGNIQVNNLGCEITNSYLFNSTSVTIAGDRFRYLGNQFGDLTFQSGTSDGIVDACAGTSVIDNGNNTVGDIA